MAHFFYNLTLNLKALTHCAALGANEKGRPTAAASVETTPHGPIVANQLGNIFANHTTAKRCVATVATIALTDTIGPGA